MPDDAIPAAVPVSRGKPLLTAVLVALAAAIGGAGGGAAIVWSGAAVSSPAAKAAEPPPKPVAPTLVELPRPFTANLRETGRYIQLSLGLAVTGGEAAADDLKHNDVAIRSAVLETLSSRSDAEIAEPDVALPNYAKGLREAPTP